MYLIAIFQFVVVALASSSEDLPDRHLIKARIFGGTEINLRDLGGYAVQIYRSRVLTCTGTLLSKVHVITAAHCFENSNYKKFYVIAGESDLLTYYFKEDRNYVIGAKIHPQFHKYSFIADIAVLKVEEPMRGRNINYLPICSTTLSAGNMVTIAGWGKTEGNDDNFSLHKIDVPLVSKPECNEKLGRKMPVNVICASGYNKKTICNGDSGGPLVYKDELCGISTWTFECGNSEKPDVFMSVYFYRDFITSAMDELGD